MFTTASDVNQVPVPDACARYTLIVPDDFLEVHSKERAIISPPEFPVPLQKSDLEVVDGGKKLRFTDLRTFRFTGGVDDNTLGINAITLKQ